MSDREGAVVEVVEPTIGSFDPPCIKPTVVLVNGTDVGLLAKDGGVVVNPADEEHDGVATVTLVLYPKRVEIRAKGMI